jgi:hypothetical protein
VSKILLSNRQTTASLWDKAFDALQKEDKARLDFNRKNKLVILSDLVDAVAEKKKLCLDNRWKYQRKSGEKIIIRDVLEKILAWVDKFKQIGNTVIQYDPAHAALPWAAVRFFLQVCDRYFLNPLTLHLLIEIISGGCK